tara:strand:- start:282 stop:674 length:393 start_codon:yes stop_codon:yes gene_type:complete
MATLNLTSDISSAGLTTDTILSNVVLTNATITTGGISRTSTTAEVGTKADLLVAASYPTVTDTKSVYVYIKNVGPNVVRLSVIDNTASNAEDEMSFAAGDWAMFPWASATNITMYQTSAGTSVVEYGVFA